MPVKNRFHHQPYPTTPTIKPEFVRLEHQVLSTPGTYSALHTKHRIREVILVHGTFVGDDPLGVSAALRSAGESVPWIGERFVAFASSLSERTKQKTNDTLKDIANFTPEFRDAFQKLVGGDPRIQLLEPGWSSQNHHLARADLAVRLLCALDDLQLDLTHERVLLWGHSHAGQGFALLSNLLANDREAVERFFAIGGETRDEYWTQASSILASANGPHPLAKAVIVASFGTPVRYGWDSEGYRYLLHISHHQPFDTEHPTQGRPLYPLPKTDDLVNARSGDWIQLGGIAGTDSPTVMERKTIDAFGELFETGLAAPVLTLDPPPIVPTKLRQLCARWKLGTRTHTDGRNLLVDYKECGREWLGLPVERSVLGHGVATTLDWLPAHLKLVLEWLDKDGISPTINS